MVQFIPSDLTFKGVRRNFPTLRGAKIHDSRTGNSASLSTDLKGINTDWFYRIILFITLPIDSSWNAALYYFVDVLAARSRTIPFTQVRIRNIEQLDIIRDASRWLCMMIIDILIVYRRRGWYIWISSIRTKASTDIESLRAFGSAVYNVTPPNRAKYFDNNPETRL